MELSFPVTESERFAAAETLIRNLVHDLRQPLSAIGTCATYLQIVLPPGSPRTAPQLQMIEEQVAEASRMLSDVVTELRNLRRHRSRETAGEVDTSLELTNSATAAVT